MFWKACVIFWLGLIREEQTTDRHGEFQTFFSNAGWKQILDIELHCPTAVQTTSDPLAPNPETRGTDIV